MSLDPVRRQQRCDSSFVILEPEKREPGREATNQVEQKLYGTTHLSKKSKILEPLLIEELAGEMLQSRNVPSPCKKATRLENESSMKRLAQQNNRMDRTAQQKWTC